MKWLDHLIDRAADRVSAKVISAIETKKLAQVDSMQQAAAIVKAVYVDLSKAAHALDIAAERMRSQGDAFGANQAKVAALAAKQANSEHVQGLRS